MPFTIMNTSEKIKNYFEHDLKKRLDAEVNGYLSRKLHSDKNAWEIITYNEVAILSLVKSALLRYEDPKNLWALQEYEVFDKAGSAKGRADLYVLFNKPDLGLELELLIEAKRDGKFNPNTFNQFEWDNSMKVAMEQGYFYFEQEAECFNKPTYVATMFFGYLNPDEKTEYGLHKTKYKPKEHDWCDYSFDVDTMDSEKTLSVYGQIQKVK